MLHRLIFIGLDTKLIITWLNQELDKLQSSKMVKHCFRLKIFSQFDICVQLWPDLAASLHTINSQIFYGEGTVSV